MLGFVQNMFGPRANPIGIDFGTETLRLAQVANVGGEIRVVAAASSDIPSDVRNDPIQRLAFFSSAIRELTSQGGFRGRQVVLGLPASALSLLHLRVPLMDDAALTKALPFEVRGKLSYDPTHAVMRHIVAGEVYHGQEKKIETIVMSSPRSSVEALLGAAGKAKLDVVGINTEPLALLDCFVRLGRRREDKESVTMYVDIGASGTRVIVALGSRVLFARGIAIGGEHFTRAVAQAMSIPFEDARLLRFRLTDVVQPGMNAGTGPEGAAVAAASQAEDVGDEQAAPEEPSTENSFALLGASIAARNGSSSAGTLLGKKERASKADEPAAQKAETAEARELRMVETAVREPLQKLIGEITLCRRYHEATFQSLPVQRAVFVGGEAKNKGLCAFVARELGLAACVGDPMSRLSKASELPPESGLDRRGPQPDWAVALGLSLGSITSEKMVEAK